MRTISPIILTKTNGGAAPTRPEGPESTVLPDARHRWLGKTKGITSHPRPRRDVTSSEEQATRTQGITGQPKSSTNPLNTSPLTIPLLPQHQLARYRRDSRSLSKEPRRDPIRRPHTTPVEKTAEKLGELPGGNSLSNSLDSQSAQQEEQSEIAKKPVEPPEGDSSDDSEPHHEPHLRNFSPSTEKYHQENCREAQKATRRRLIERLIGFPLGLVRGTKRTRREAQSTQVHHPRLRITEVTEQRIIGSLPDLGPASLFASRQPQEEPIRASRRSLNKALKRDR
ncbi:hypothetical protein DSL72_005130 [Monilinia vaccinii-corymbosi]|uniref:Uncharacterized protein n=1 Tax=Monilinia vaccinii-corymbosi TaxID=61207 RepID=A0A8A3PEC4_9HELO|nr:hypothetical protein DSL72_005130 [Monilinia vaccinii-corymbosi]